MGTKFIGLTRYLAYTLLCCAFLCCFQTVSSQESTTQSLLKEHIVYLASDELQGRATGSEGEKLAYEYIIKEFKEIGLIPKGVDDTYLQKFEFTDGYTIPESNNLFLGNKKLELNKDYFIHPASATSDIDHCLLDLGYGIEAPKLNRNDYSKKVKDKGNQSFIIKLGSPDTNPHSELSILSDVDAKIQKAIEKGAEMVCLIGNENQIDKEKTSWEMFSRVTKYTVPVILMLEKNIYQNSSSIKKLNFNGFIGLEKNVKFGHNVIGFLDNGAKNTVVIGGHYDHLGLGGHGSLHNGIGEIHNGADDNASGISLIIELARDLFKNKEQSYLNNNYLFICFSGEEMGLYGSKFYAQNPTIENNLINYMLNFDMVGRLDTIKPTLIINGTGTSSEWEYLKTLDNPDMKIKTSDSGIGPSDHTSFYLKDIPAIHFFTGAHGDYHKPTDDEYLINYEGLLQLKSLIEGLINELGAEPEKIDFTKTKDKESGATPRFTVGLGVIPDYMFDGSGMRIDAVRDGKVASKAGLKDGDVVIQMGDVIVKDMETYMKALSKFKKGDSTSVVVEREGKQISKQITFF